MYYAKLCILFMMMSLVSGCTVIKVVDMAASAALTTVEIAAKTTVKVVELAIPDGDDDEDDEKDKDD